MAKIILTSLIIHILIIWHLTKEKQKPPNITVNLRQPVKLSIETPKLKIAKHPTIDPSLRIRVTKKKNHNSKDPSLRVRAKGKKNYKDYSDLITQSQKFLLKKGLQTHENNTDSSGSNGSEKYSSNFKALGEEFFLQIPLPAYVDYLDKYLSATVTYQKCPDSKWVFTQHKGDAILARHVYKFMKKSNVFTTKTTSFLKNKNILQLEYILEKSEDFKNREYSLRPKGKNLYSFHYKLPADMLDNVLPDEKSAIHSSNDGGAIDLLVLGLKIERFIAGKKENPILHKIRKTPLKLEKCR